MSVNLGYLFRLVWYDTDANDKYDTDRRHEYLADAEAILSLHYALERTGAKHVEVYSLDGRKQDPSRGRRGLVGYSV